MIITFVTIVHIIACFFLMLVVLLQAGKGGGMGIAFGSAGAQQVFGGRGAGNFLEKLTAVFAALFMATSISLAYFASRTESSRLQQRSEQVSKEREEKKKRQAEQDKKAAEEARKALEAAKNTSAAPASPVNNAPTTSAPPAGAGTSATAPGAAAPPAPSGTPPAPTPVPPAPPPQ